MQQMKNLMKIEIEEEFDVEIVKINYFAKEAFT